MRPDDVSGAAQGGGSGRDSGGGLAASASLHSILALVAPSDEQAPAVHAEGHDVLVTAGAGTGKTRTLVGRYLRMLEDGVPPRRIAAITFTKKAAREMRNRVREAIRDYLRSEELDDESRERWRELYTKLDAARIGTIHSLCTEILRAHPAEAGLDPRFEVLDEVQSALSLAEAVDATMAWTADDESASRWFDHLGDRDLRKLLDSLMRQRTDAAEAFAALGDDPLALWREALEAEQDAALRSLLANPAWRDAVADLEHHRADDPSDTLDGIRRAVLAAIEGVVAIKANVGGRATPGDGREGAGDDRAQADVGPEIDIQRPADFDTAIEVASREISEVRLNAAGTSQKRWPGGKDDLDAVKAALKVVRQMWGEAKVLALRLGPADEALAADLPSLRAAFQRAVLALDGLKRERNVLDFEDLETMARDLLRDREDVRLRWNEELDAVLVDEFQDTNSRQQAIVEHLVPEGRRFYVGDAKQSIYRFRGADVTGMRAMGRRMADGHGESFALATSYRSHAALVAAQNALLEPVLGTDEDPSRPFVEPFSPLEAHRKSAPEGMDGPFVELHLGIGTKESGAHRRAAGALVDRFIELVEDGRISVVSEDGVARGLEYGDIAILCRASTSFAEYEEALEQAGVPYVTTAGRGFYERPEIRDLQNALRALSDPHDDLALVGLLRSPAFAVSDPGIYRLCGRRDELATDGVAHSLWDHMRQEVAARDDAARDDAAAIASTAPGSKAEDAQAAADLQRIDRAWRVVGGLRALAGRVTVGELLAAYLDTTAYPAMLRLAGDHRAARNVDKLLDDARASRLVGVGDFIEWMASISSASAREGEARAVAEGMVRILTIHSAKGLEFPVVALGDMGKAAGGRSNGLMVDDQLGVLPKIVDESGDGPAAYELAKLLETSRDDAESRRLLYVAVTRAKDLVLLSGSAGRNKGGELSKLGGWLGLVADALPIDSLDAASIAPESSAPVTTTVRSPFELTATLYPEAFEPARRAAVVTPPTSQITTTATTATTTLPDLVEPIKRDQTVDLAGEEASEARRDPPRRVWRVVPEERTRARPPTWVIGTLVHKAIERWRFPADDPEINTWLAALARESGIIDRREADFAVKGAMSLLDRFADHPLRHTLERAEHRMHEVPYAVKDKDSSGRVREGYIDLLYRLDGRWTILDFKVDDVRPHNLEQFKKTLFEPRGGYVGQVAEYADAVQEILRGERPRTVLCLLDFEGGIRLCEVRDRASAEEILGVPAGV